MERNTRGKHNTEFANVGRIELRVMGCLNLTHTQLIKFDLHQKEEGNEKQHQWYQF